MALRHRVINKKLGEYHSAGKATSTRKKYFLLPKVSKNFRQKQWTADRGAVRTIVQAADTSKGGCRILPDSRP